MNIDIKKVAKFSCLAISDEETSCFTQDIQNVVDMMDRLPDVGDMFLSLDPENPMLLRGDEVEVTISRKEMLGNAPKVEAGCFVVPSVVEE